MAADVGTGRRVAVAASWPLGVAITTWHYLWRILPVHRREEEGSLERDVPPPLPVGTDAEELQTLASGRGPLLHRLYSARIADAQLGPQELIALAKEDPGRFAPWQIARFRKTRGREGELAPGDEYLVHMPGPWDGPVRVVAVEADRFRFATLRGHLEAGQIEWRASRQQDGLLRFTVESWARPGDMLSSLLHDKLKMAKEVQLYMWTSVCERAPRIAGGRLVDGVEVLTRTVPESAFARPNGLPGAR